MNNCTIIPLDNISYNENNCLARKSSDPYRQCCYKKKIGDLCKIHHNAKYCIRIDEHIDKKRKFIKSKKLKSNKIKIIKIEDYYKFKNTNLDECLFDTEQIDLVIVLKKHTNYINYIKI